MSKVLPPLPLLPEPALVIDGALYFSREQMVDYGKAVVQRVTDPRAIDVTNALCNVRCTEDAMKLDRIKIW